ncbi:MAG: TlpA disulfide reductase family protein [bacterium]
MTTSGNAGQVSEYRIEELTVRYITILLLALTTILLASCGSEEVTTDAQASGTDIATRVQSESPEPGQTTIKPTSVQDIKSAKIVFEAYDIDGTLHKSDEWIGKQPVVINVWGTWCPPCRREIPDLVKVYNEYRYKGIEILGLAVRDTPEKVRNFIGPNGMEWTMMMADQSTLATMGRISGVPTTIFLNKDGQEVARFVGPRSYEVFKETFESLL